MNTRILSLMLMACSAQSLCSDEIPSKRNLEYEFYLRSADRLANVVIACPFKIEKKAATPEVSELAISFTVVRNVKGEKKFGEHIKVLKYVDASHERSYGLGVLRLLFFDSMGDEILIEEGCMPLYSTKLFDYLSEKLETSEKKGAG